MFVHKCEICKKNRFFVKVRSMIPKELGTLITSQKKMCRKCFKGVKQLIFKQS